MFLGFPYNPVGCIPSNIRVCIEVRSDAIHVRKATYPTRRTGCASLSAGRTG
jgi:hypothetical protein